MSARHVEDAYPLSPLQEGLLFHALAAGEPGMYVTQVGYTLAGRLDLELFERAWQAVVQRHPALRTAFAWKSAERPIQVVGREVRVPLAVEDWRGLPAAERDRLWEERLTADRARGIDPTRAPLLRLFVAREQEGLHRLLWTHHHLLLDGWSVGLVLQEAFATYRAALRGIDPALPPAAPFRAYIAWLRRRDPADAEPFWRRELAGFTAPTPLPWSAGDPAAAVDRDGERSLRLAPEAADALRARSRRWQVTPSTLVYAAWSLLLGRHAGEDDVVFGVTTAGRPADLAGVEGIVGLFINTLPLRVDVRPGQPLLPWLRALQQRQVEMRQHEYVPLVTVQGWSEVPRGLPLFESFVAFESYPAERSAPEEGDLEVRGVRAVERTSYPLGLAASPALSLRATFDPRRFEAVTVDRLLSHLGLLLAALGAPENEAERAIGDLPLLGEGERAQLLVEWNDTVLPLPPDTVPALFATRAAQAPAAVALRDGERVLSYGELAARADRLARRLRGRGIGSGDVVGVACERSPELVVTLLGVLRAGAVFLPLDPSHPPERTAWIAEDAGVAAILTGDLEEGGTEAALPSVAPSDPAYLIYTSGTTGRPKGVLVEHRSLAATLLGAAATFGFDAADRMPCVAPVPFDIFLFELLSPLLAGGTAILVPLTPAPDMERLVDLLAEATRFHAVPALMRQVADAVRARGGAAWLSTLRTLFVGGDAVPARLVADLRELFPAAEVRVLYGPTETAILCASHRVEERGEMDAPLGRPLPNAEIRLLDAHGRLVPVGAPGEIWIGGAGVARGYHRRDELTAERFRESGGGRFYRSGDRARRRPDGTLEFLGRIDQQVKIRGVRVEPAEIEAVLAAEPGVREAVVVARPDAAGETSLLACVVPVRDAELTPAGLRSRLRALLPDAFVPSEILLLSELPVTAHGKVDRAALARLRAAGAPAGRAFRDPLEELVAGIFAEVLGREVVGADEDFFELGGHSLLATRVAARLRAALGVELPLRELFEASTAAALARRVAAPVGSAVCAPPLRRGPRPYLLPLSFGQERLWFLHRLEPGSAAYILPAALRLTGPLSIPALAGSLAALAARHEILRTTFDEVEGAPFQRVHPPGARTLPVVDLTALPVRARQDEARRRAQDETRRAFDLQRGPLLAATLLRLAAEEHVVLLSVHHIVSDGWSMGVLIGELAAAYGALAKHGEPDLPALPLQYGDFALWQRGWLTGAALTERLAWWTEQLAGAPPVLALPFDRPRPAVQSYRGDALPYALSEELSRGLRGLGRRQGVTLFMTVLAGMAALLRRWCGEDDLCIGTPIAGRTHLETEPLIGLFLNTLVLRVRTGNRLCFDRLLAEVREVSFGAFAHQELPFEKLVEALQPQRSLSWNPLFQVMLSWQNAPRRDVALPGLDLAPLDLAETATQLDLDLFAAEVDGRVAGSLKYATDLFDPTTVRRLLGHFENLLSAAAADPARELSDLPLLSAGERHQLLVEWRGGGLTLPNGVAVHHLILEQARRTPGAWAVACGSERLTYAELDRRSGVLAERLVAAGAGVETVVCLLAERGVDFVVAVVAVLRTGAAWLPLDPQHPPARLAQVIRLSGTPVVLVDDESAGRLSLALADLPAAVRPRQLALVAAASGEAPPVPPALPESLAYGLFTSGSTGVPKGVLVSQGGLLHHLLFKIRDLSLGPGDAIAQTAPQCFDISVWQMLTPLVVGGRVEVFPNAVAQDPLLLLSETERTGVAVLEVVPSLLRLLLDEVEARGSATPRLAGLRWLMPTGEALPPDLVRRWCARFPAVPLLNAYGPSECTDDVALQVLREPLPAGTLQVPIGRAVPNTLLVVLDRELLPVPIGVPGQLFVSGIMVGRGYLGDPGRTAAAFLPDPFAAEPGGRMYATGDLTRYAAAGWLDFLGRIDHQVKVRGFRIELGEVEAALAAHPEVAESVAVADQQAGLTGFVVLRPGAAADPRDLRDRLRAVLPEYMVPGRIVLLPDLPLSPNGKVDRQALARMQPEPAAAPAAGAPAGAAAELLAVLWAKLLGVERVGSCDHFFDLGGHSLLATQLAAGVRRALGVELPLREIFERPVLADMAAAVESLLRGDRVPAPPLLRVPRGGPLPLSSAQQRLWFFDRWEPGSPAYNIPSAVRLEGDLDVAALAATLTEIVRRHEILRTTYVDLDGEPGQVVGPAVPVPLPLIDLAALPPYAREGEASRLAAAEGARPFDLAQGPVLRAALLRLGGREHIALLTLHHIAADAWSTHLLVGEIAVLYAAFHARRPSPLPGLPVQYADFAVWQRARLADGSLERQADYWRERLQGLPGLELPTDRPRPAVQSFRGAQRATSLPFLPEVRALARAEDATLFMVLLAAFDVVLAHHSGQDDVVVGTNVAGRTRAEAEGLIGFFLNMLVLRTDLSGDPTFRGLVARVRETALGAYAHQDLPFDRLVEALRVRRDPGRHPLFQIKVDFQAMEETQEPLPDLTLRPVPPAEAAAHSDLTVYFSESPDRISVVWEHNTDLFDTATILDLSADLELVLRRSVDAPDVQLSALRGLLAAEAERRRADREREFQAARRGEIRSFRRRAVAAL
jgi:amino acid adenylation domain-containing protein